MTRVKLRRDAEITLPKEICDALHLAEGDELEAQIGSDGVFLRKVARDDRMTAAGALLDEIRRSVRPTPEQAAKPLEQQEEEILEVVDEVRRAYAHERGAR